MSTRKVHVVSLGCPKARVDTEAAHVPLNPGRAMLSRAALMALPADERRRFEYAGRFRLQGFEDPEELWLES